MKSLQLVHRWLGIFVFLVLWGLHNAGYAGQTYYVSPQGSDSNTGLITSPWRNLETAVTKVSAGDTIMLRGGTHIVNQVWIRRDRGMGGALGQYLTIKAYAGEQPIMQPGRRRLIIDADYVRVEGLHFVMPWRCEAFGKGLEIVKNKFTGPQPKFGAITIGGSDILIEGNEIILDGGGNTMDHGIYVHAGTNITVRNNTIIGSQGYGIHIFDEHKSANRADWAKRPLVMTGYIIESNFVADSKSRSGVIIAKGRGANYIKLGNIVVKNNIFVGNAAFGLFIRQGENISAYNNTFYRNRNVSLFIREPKKGGKPISDVTIKNNIFVGRAHIRNKSPGENIVLENNLYDTGPRLQGIADPKMIIKDPEFVDANSNNFHLQSSSPAIDAGVDVGLAFKGSAPDLGAFEFGDLIARVNTSIAEVSAPAEDSNSANEPPALEDRVSSQNLVSFQAFVVGNSVILNWRMAPESKYSGFEIQRSSNKKDFTKIGLIRDFSKSNKSKSYQYFDGGLKPGRYYYRLKQVASGHAFDYSYIIEASIDSL